jgi:hypothetical protein
MSFCSHLVGSFRRRLISPTMGVFFRSAAVVMVSLLILAGCSAAAASTSSGTTPSASTVTIQPIPTATWNSMGIHAFTPPPTFGTPLYEAWFITLFGWVQSIAIEGFIEATLANWTDNTPPSYSSTGYTITWSHTGNTWTWTITTTSPSHTIVVTVTSTSSGWSLTVTEDTVPWLTGSINSNGTSGTATFKDPSGTIPGTITTVWTSASSPYNYQYTITATGSFALAGGLSVTSATVVLQTKSDGTAWTWTYNDSNGVVDHLVGTYP